MTTSSIKTRLARDLDGAFPQLVAEYQRGIYSGVLRLTRNPEDAADLTQDTFVRAYRALQGYGPDRIAELRVEGWLWTIALNLCRNRARSRSRRPRLVSLDLVEPPGDANTEEQALAFEGPLVEALALLTRTQRECVVLRHVVGLSYPAMSEALNRPEGTLKSEVHRGLRRLETILGDTYE